MQIRQTINESQTNTTDDKRNDIIIGFVQRFDPQPKKLLTFIP